MFSPVPHNFYCKLKKGAICKEDCSLCNLNSHKSRSPYELYNVFMQRIKYSVNKHQESFETSVGSFYEYQTFLKTKLYCPLGSWLTAVIISIPSSISSSGTSEAILPKTL